MVRHPLILVALSSACYSPNVPLSGEDSSEATSAGHETGAATSTAEAGTDPTIDTGSDSTGEASSEASSGSTGAAPVAVCGDGRVEGDEVCDDTVNDGSYGGCAIDCGSLGPRCGDDVAQPVEDCDDGNGANGDGCNNDCVESGTTLWTRTHDGPAHEDDAGHGVAISPEGEIVVAGAQGINADDSHVWLRRYTGEGDELWTETFVGFGGNSTAFGVAVDDAGVAYACGKHAGGTNDTIWARALDLDGGLAWSHVYDSPAVGIDECRDVVVDEDGDAVLVGQYATPSDGLNIWVRRLDGGDGEEFWTRTFDHEGGPDNASGAAHTEDGFIYVGGKQGIANGSQSWLRKYDTNGAVQWTRSRGAGGWGAIEGVAVDSAGNVFVAGRETGTPQEVSTIWLAKYDANGELQWSVNEDFGTLDSGFGAACDSDGNVALVATAADGVYAAWVAKYDGDGAMLWSQFPHEGIAEVTASFAFGVDIDGEDNVVVVGAEERPNDGQFDVWVQKFAP